MLNVITDNVIIWLIWSNWSSPKILPLKYFIYPLIAISQLMLSVSLLPKVITLSDFTVIVWCCSGIQFWIRFFNKYKNKSQQIYFFCFEEKLLFDQEFPSDEKQLKAHYTSKIFSIPILKCHFLMDRKDSSFFSVSFWKLSFDLIFSLTLEVNNFLNILLLLGSLWLSNHWSFKVNQLIRMIT